MESGCTVWKCQTEQHLSDILVAEKTRKQHTVVLCCANEDGAIRFTSLHTIKARLLFFFCDKLLNEPCFSKLFYWSKNEFNNFLYLISCSWCLHWETWNRKSLVCRYVADFRTRVSIFLICNIKRLLFSPFQYFKSFCLHFYARIFVSVWHESQKLWLSFVIDDPGSTCANVYEIYQLIVKSLMHDIFC